MRSTSGSSIDKFELMEHPSAKYDAEGQGGIINIKTKRNALSGLNGEIGTDDGGMYFGETGRFLMRENVNGSLSYRTAKTNTFVSAYQGIYDMDIDMNIDNKLTQDGVPFRILARSLQKDRYRNWQVRFGNDWFIDKKNTLGFIVNMPSSRNIMKSDRDHNVTTQTLGDKELERAESATWNEDKSRQTNGNLNFTHIFNEATNSEITVNMDYYHNADWTGNDQKTFTRNMGASEWIPSTRYIDSDNKVNIWSAKADYEGTVFNFARLEAGVKWALSKTDNTTLRTETGPSASDAETRFKYRENIGAAYLSLAAQFGPKWTAKAGLRGEYTNSFGDWISAGDESRRSYFDLFPTAFVGFNPSASLRFALSYSGQTVWATQKAMAMLFDCSADNIGLHLKNIYDTNELNKEATTEKISVVQQEGVREVRRNTLFYNLDAIISVGYRVNSIRATQFRQWCTYVIRQFSLRGYIIDKKRMENGSFISEDYFEHLLAEIREIRLSERRFYQKLTDIYATAVDYNKDAPTTRLFYKKVQNKMHYAVHGHTAAELIVERANAEKEHMGLTTWENAPDGKIVKPDVSIAKNYLKQVELEDMGKLVNSVLDLAERMANRHIPMTMEDWAKRIDIILEAGGDAVLHDAGKVSAEFAKSFAESEFEKYRVIQDKLFNSDFDKFNSLPFDDIKN